jgi:hypothetical protein
MGFPDKISNITQLFTLMFTEWTTSTISYNTLKTGFTYTFHTLLTGIKSITIIT